MKLIKLITAVVMSFGLMIAQPPTQGGNQGGTQGPPPCDQWLNSDMAHDMNNDGVVDEGDCPGQGGPPQGPPPCDEWLNSDMAHDMNNDGVVDEGDCPGQGPDPFQQAFMTTMQNGGTPDEAFEAVAAVFHQMAVECDDCEMPEEEFQEGKAEAKAAFDAVLANGGTPEEAFHAAMETSSNDGPATCDVCGHEYGGPDDHHGHCRECGAEMNADEDWQSHCEENPDHCKAQAGDTCGYVGPSGDECGYVHTGDEGEDHHHCDTCGMPVNSGDEMGAHCDENPGHCGGPGPGGPGPDGPQHYPNNHWDGNCGAMMNGQSEYWLDSDGDPDNGPEDGPYAVWHEDADGNPVNCGPGPGHEGDGGPATCDVCGHEYGGPDDHHGHCRECGAEMNADEDWQSHCEENPDHCKAQAGDTCGYVGPSGDECGYVHTGDEGEDHHHCDTCGMPVNSGDEMGAHCDENPGHCGGPQGPPPTCEEVDTNGDGSIDRDEARAKFGHDPQGNPDPNFDQRYDEVDANGDGVVDCGEHDAAVAEGENNN